MDIKSKERLAMVGMVAMYAFFIYVFYLWGAA